MNDVQAALVRFFRGLADGKRLQVAGRLAGGRLSVEQLAAELREKPADIQHHLARLAEAGLVTGPSGPGQSYRLRLDHVHSLAGQVLAREQTHVPADAAGDATEHKVLRDFLRPDGTIRDLPAQEKKFQVLLRYAWRQFEPGRRYSEKEVNAYLQRLHPDSAALRRGMVDSGLLMRSARPGSPSEYWKAEPATTAAPV
jgi:ArsR family transcriptional regulator, arsenate/arsenite/antimonite-responsive transcriptional repressor